jgi:hypothetical protein
MGSTARRLVLAVLGLASARCSANMNVKAEASMSTPEDDRRWEVPESGRADAAPPVVVANALVGTDPEAIGVTHDLSLRPEVARTPACSCLAVAYGASNDPRFLWQAGSPRGGANTIAIAISGDLDCSATDAKGRRPAKPSIAGVGHEGDDIVLTIEGAEGGRPVVLGAIAVRSAATGAILIRAKSPLPYGTPVGARSGVCRIPLK